MSATEQTPQKLAALFREYRVNPVKFVRDQFGAEPDVWQAEMLMALVDNQRVGMKACKGPGKSCGEAWAGWWFLACFPHAKCLATSITGDNLRDNLWAELATWQKKSPLLMSQFQWNVERITQKKHPETWFLSARSWSKQADKGTQSNTLAGHHGEYTLILIDEAGDIPSGVVASADASLSTGKVNRILMAGNPTRTEGPLYDAWNSQRHLWWMKEITGDPADPSRSKRISIKWAQEQIDLWGREHPWVMVNVLGKFPSTQSDKLLGPDDVQAAQDRKVSQAEWQHEPKIMALDVARFGDDRSVLGIRQGKVVPLTRTYRNLDLMELAEQAAREYWEHLPDALFVDETGIGGGVVDRLRQLQIPVIGINFGSKPKDAKFADKRTEMWWDMAIWIKGRNGPDTGGCLPRTPELAAELLAPSYYFTANNKMRLESKDDMKKRGIASPDEADMLAMTFSEQVAPKPPAVLGSVRPSAVLYDYDPYSDEGRA